MLCSWNYLTVNVALWHVNSKELVDFQLTHLVQNLLESSELPVTIASIRLAAGAGTRCPVMIAHRADSDWEISHHDHRMSSLKCLRTPGWRKQKQICLLFLVEGIRNRFVCYLAFICSESKKLIWVMSFSLHTSCCPFLYPCTLPLTFPRQLCKKMPWNWFYWLWRMARPCPGRCWFYS